MDMFLYSTLVYFFFIIYGQHFLKPSYIKYYKIICTLWGQLIIIMKDIDWGCRVTICSPNPEELGYKPNEPNTINL